SCSAALPRNPQQTTDRPAARAPRATSSGNTPSPAINPSGSTAVGWALLAFFQDGYSRSPRVGPCGLARATQDGSARSEQSKFLLARGLPRWIEQLAHFDRTQLLGQPFGSVLELVVHLLLVQGIERVEVDRLLFQLQLPELIGRQRR